MRLDVAVLVRAPRWKERLKPHVKTVRAACEAALVGFKGGKGVAISVVLADDDFIRELNKTYRGKNKPTNVLSFYNSEAPLGDMVLAYETVAREAKAQKKTFKAHAIHLMVHGCLHLMGYDHECENEAEEMEAMEIKILKKLGVRNPYL